MSTATLDAVPADVSACFLAAEHQECWSRLLYVAEQGNRLGVLTGAAEVGKSTLLRGVAQQLKHRDHRQWLAVDATGFTLEEFTLAVHAVCEGGEPDQPLWQGIEDWLWGIASTRRPVLWTIDHVDQSLDDLLPGIRRLIRVIEQTGAPASLLLAARDWESVSELTDLIDISGELPAWEFGSTDAYIMRYRAQRPGSATFTSDAIQGIFDCTHGVAGRIHRLCELCRLAAEMRDDDEIDVELVLEVWGELLSPLARQQHGTNGR